MKYFLIFFLFVSGLNVQAQSGEKVLAKVGGADISVSEFTYIYEKNNGTTASYSEKSLQEYLDLYIKFKLKVEKARQMKLDTISALKEELEGYRKQLASSYLIDKEVTEFLIRELYERTKKDVLFSHIFISVPEGSPKNVKEEAKNTLRDIKSKIIGGMSFEEAAKLHSQDKTTAEKGGNMGYFTAKLPSGFYDLESALYNTPVSKMSDIIESKLGMHLIQVKNVRPARGIIEVAHILLKFEQKQLADSLYREVSAGKDFELLALQYSQDKATYKNGGKLAPFGINTYDKAFEDAAFSLNNDGEISRPVATTSGWHIIKRISRPQPDTYEVFAKRMKAQISKDQRFDIAKLSLIEDIKKTAGFKENPDVLQRFISDLGDDFYSYKWVPAEYSKEELLFSIGGNTLYSLKDFAEYCRKNTRTRLKYDSAKPRAEAVRELYKEFVNEKSLAFEEASLEVKYPDFKSLMREYEEGILLFEATKIHVWDKANQDTVGLNEFFKGVSRQYIWDEKYSVSEYTITGVDQKKADKIYKFAMKNTPEKTKGKFSKKEIKVDVTSGAFEKDAKEMKGIQAQAGYTSPMTFNSENKKYSFTKVENVIPRQQKTLSEARGYVVADYQDFLEKVWVDSLRNEFMVIKNNDVINSLIR
jgi:peptidyl-prolyl cis-trans isomerase SurA